MESNSSLSQNNPDAGLSSNPEPMNYYGSFIFPIFTLLLATTCLATAIYTIIHNSNLIKNSYIPEYLFVSGIVLLIDFSMMLIQSIFKKHRIVCRSKLLSQIIGWLLLIGYSSLIIIGFIFCLHLDDKINNSKDSGLSIAFFSTYCFIVFRAAIEILSFIILKVLQKAFKKNETGELLYEVVTGDASPPTTNRKSAIDLNFEEHNKYIHEREDKEKIISKNGIDSNSNSRNTSYRDGESTPGSPDVKSLNQWNSQSTENKNKENSEENSTPTHSSSNPLATSQLTSSELYNESHEIKLFSNYKQGDVDKIIPSSSLIEDCKEPEIVGYEEQVEVYTLIPQSIVEREAKENSSVRILRTSEHEKTNSSLSLSFQGKTFS
ncbi:unnamed protein product [Blepharisma stoltei]|uniref:Uncharacterized protein n=1 Tax=Blepharisma stoltei TaxID=1481888 RepID=A0AAU9K5Q4_9CILI|nr:unnamed protein product [Blepharisma stoltei]